MDAAAAIAIRPPNGINLRLFFMFPPEFVIMPTAYGLEDELKINGWTATQPLDGSEMTNVEPDGDDRASTTSPPWTFAIQRDRARPSPAPSWALDLREASPR